MAGTVRAGSHTSLHAGRARHRGGSNRFSASRSKGAPTPRRRQEKSVLLNIFSKIGPRLGHAPGAYLAAGRRRAGEVPPGSPDKTGTRWPSSSGQQLAPCRPATKANLRIRAAVPGRAARQGVCRKAGTVFAFAALPPCQVRCARIFQGRERGQGIPSGPGGRAGPWIWFANEPGSPPAPISELDRWDGPTFSRPLVAAPRRTFRRKVPAGGSRAIDASGRVTQGRDCREERSSVRHSRLTIRHSPSAAHGGDTSTAR
jgi:hypothetical protein